MGTELVPLPPQPPAIPWPTQDWPVSEPPPEVDVAARTALLDATFAQPQPPTTVQTNDLLVVHRGRIVAERYAAGVGPDDVQPSWSMAKSFLHAVVGVLVGDGRLDVAAPAQVPEWQAPGDPRAAITLDSLLHMTPGLRFVEDYVDARVSDVIKMLFDPGADDTGAFAAALAADHPPDTAFNYSSGTSNIISAIVKREVGAGDDYLSFLRRRLFEPTGIFSAAPGSTAPVPGSAPRSATAPRATSPASASSTCAAASGTACPSFPRAGWTMGARPRLYSPTPKRAPSATARTGGFQTMGWGPSPPTAMRASTSSSYPRST